MVRAGVKAGVKGGVDLGWISRGARRELSVPRGELAPEIHIWGELVSQRRRLSSGDQVCSRGGGWRGGGWLGGGWLGGG